MGFIGKTFVFLLFVIVVGMGIYAIFSQTEGLKVEREDGVSKMEGLKNEIFWWRGDNFKKNLEKPLERNEVKQNQIEEKPKPKPIPPSGFSEKDLSPFYGQVIIKKVNPPNPYSYSPAQVLTLSAEPGNNEPIFITGWKLRGNRSGDTFVPFGIADMSPVNLGGVETRIALSPGEYANFYTNASAIKRNFRLNKCTGFLNNFYAFVPTLPNDCPKLFERGEAVTFSGTCQSFLFSLRACANISPNDRNRFGSEQDLGCRAIMDRYNFGYCYNKFRSQANFFSKEWRIWLDNRPNFDRQHDRILLFDNAGLLVDEYIY